MVLEHKFQDMILDIRVCGLILAAKDSYMVWVGTAEASFGSLDVAMMTNMDSLPVSSSLLGTGPDAPGASLAKRLSMKTKSQVFLSYNLPATMEMLHIEVEKRLIQELKAVAAKQQSQ